MEDAIRHERLPFGRWQRADEIGVHERRNGLNLLLFAVVGLLALGLLALGVQQCNRSASLKAGAPAVTPLEHEIPTTQRMTEGLVPPVPPVVDPGATPRVETSPPGGDGALLVAPSQTDEEEKKAADTELEAKEPKVAIPEVEEPKVAIPEAEEPKVAIPEAEEPKVAIPKTDLPKATIPRVDAPKAATPKVTAKADQPAAGTRSGAATSRMQPDGTATARGATAAPAAGAAASASGGTCYRVDIKFKPNGNDYSDDDYTAIQRLADCLKRNPQSVVKIEGRTDGREQSHPTDPMDQRRAALLEYELLKRGVDDDQILRANTVEQCTSSDADECRQWNRGVSAVTE